MNTIVAVGSIIGLVCVPALLLYLTLKAPGRNKRGNWHLRMVGFAIGIAMTSIGAFAHVNAEDPLGPVATAGIFLAGIGLLMAFMSVVMTTRKEQEDSCV